MNTIRIFAFALVTLGSLGWSAQAGEVTLPHTFQAGTPAVAAQVNDNFNAVKGAVDDNHTRIAALEAALAALQATVADQASLITALQATASDQANTIAALQTRLAGVEVSEIMALDPYVTVDTDGRGPLVRLSGVNLQVVNGQGRTDSVNGLGNLIIGYDEVNTNPSLQHCSDGAYADGGSCISAGQIWDFSHKNGSHYLVTGMENNYSQYGGIVAGLRNFATGAGGSVTGGEGNTSCGSNSSVSGGCGNTASGASSSVSGGYGNTASGASSSVSGGENNTASGTTSSASGGAGNTAGNAASSISGGFLNEASGRASSVSGGAVNTASGEGSSVSGGSGHEVNVTYGWAAGTP